MKFVCYVLSIVLPCAVLAFAGFGVSSHAVVAATRANHHHQRQSRVDHQGKLLYLDGDCHECHGNHNHRDQWQQTDDGGRWRSRVGRSDLDDHLHRDGNWSWRHSLCKREDHRNDRRQWRLVGAPTVTVSANPTTIAKGSTSAVTVTATNATQVTLDGSNNSKRTLGATGGTVSVAPTSTTTYTATATGAGGTATASVTITVGSGSGQAGGASN